jgi:hypothetical protein
MQVMIKDKQFHVEGHTLPSLTAIVIRNQDSVTQGVQLQSLQSCSFEARKARLKRSRRKQEHSLFRLTQGRW